MSEFSHHLIRLLADLAQVNTPNSLHELFIAGIRKLLPHVQLTWHAVQPEANYLTIRTTNTIYGYLTYSGSVAPNALAAMQSTTPILASYFERIEQKNQLATANQQGSHPLHHISVVAEASFINAQKTTNETERSKAMQYLNAAGIVYIALNKKTEITLANPKACALLGATADELLGKSWIDTFIPKLEQEGVTNAFFELIENQNETYFHHINSIKNLRGELLTIEWHNSLLKNYAGNITGVLSSGIDITDKIKTQHDLLHNKLFIDKVLNTSPNLIYIFDVKENRNIYSNQWVEKILGFSAQEIKKMGSMLLPVLLHPGDLKRIAEHHKQLIDNNNDKIYTIDYRIKNSEGEYKYICSRDTTFEHDKQGKVKQIIGVAVDVTEQKNAEVKLRTSQRKLSNLITNFSGIAFSCLNDKFWTMLFLSRAVEKVTGYQANELLFNQTASFESIIHPEDRQHMRQSIESALEKNKQFSIEYRIITKTGSAKWVWAQGSSNYDNEQQQWVIDGLIHDINKRKIAEQALLERDLHFTSLLKNPQGYLIYRTRTSHTTAQTEVTHVSPSITEVLGIKPESAFVFDQWFLNAHPSDYELLQNAFKIAMHKPFVVNEQIRHYHPTRGLSWFQIRANGIPFAGNPRVAEYFNGIILDITEQKLTENALLEKNEEIRSQNEEFITLNEELQDSINHIQQINVELKKAKRRAEENDRLKSAFLANMSHEIRTPMNGIIGFAHLLASNKITNEKRKLYTNIIVLNSEQLLATVNDILDISKIETKQAEVFAETISINPVLEELTAFFLPKAHSKNLQLNLHKSLPDAQAVLHTDHMKFRQVVTNLLNNAIKFTEKGTISIGYTTHQNTFTFYVKDSGIGIEANKKEHIFERFQQAEQTIAQQYGGTGLGLAICKGNIELMGGKIWVDSSLGQGATFSFALPANQNVKQKSVEQENSAKHNNFNFNKTKILIVEDEEVNFLFLEVLLQEHNLEIVRAKNGIEAVELAADNSIQLVLMDIKMPLMDGYEATRRIKKNRPELAIIAQTAFAMHGDREKALDAGCDDHIGKPIKEADLLHLLHRWLGKLG